MVSKYLNGNQTSCVLPPVSQQPVSSVAPRASSRLRVGKVVSDARVAVQAEEAWQRRSLLAPAPSLMSRAIDDGEQRVQQELLDMLTAKLARKERDVEQYRWQNEALEREKHEHESVVEQLTTELQRSRDELAVQISRLTVELREREDDACQARNAAAQAHSMASSHSQALQDAERRCIQYAERLRLVEAQQQREVADARRQVAAVLAEKQVLEGRVVGTQQQQRTLAMQLEEHTSKSAELEAQVAQWQTQFQLMQQQAQDAREDCARQSHTRQALEQEKKALEERVQQLTQTLRGVTSRASEAEKRKSSLAQSETHLTKQLTQLHRENEELKARTGQLLAQSKQQQARIAQLETAKAAIEAKHEDTAGDIAHARKRCSEYQFRIRQLQEELTFLTKKNPHKDTAQSDVAATTTTKHPGALLPADATDTTVPSWMRD